MCFLSKSKLLDPFNEQQHRCLDEDIVDPRSYWKDLFEQGEEKPPIVSD